MEASSVTGTLFEQLNFRAEKQKVISSNIANINTPNYKTKKLLDDIEAKGFSKITMVVDPVLRKRISEIYEKFGLQVSVLSHAELDSKANFAIEGTLEF
jgi:flagellar biosynthesis protein FlhA